MFENITVREFKIKDFTWKNAFKELYYAFQNTLWISYYKDDFFDERGIEIVFFNKIIDIDLSGK